MKAATIERGLCALERIADNLEAIRDRAVMDRLRDRYGIGRAEARVGMLLCEGKTRTEIAKTLNVAENTVKNQLNSMFGKTGTKRQAELVLAFIAEGARK